MNHRHRTHAVTMKKEMFPTGVIDEASQAVREPQVKICRTGPGPSLAKSTVLLLCKRKRSKMKNVGGK